MNIVENVIPYGGTEEAGMWMWNMDLMQLFCDSEENFKESERITKMLAPGITDPLNQTP